MIFHTSNKTNNCINIQFSYHINYWFTLGRCFTVPLIQKIVLYSTKAICSSQFNINYHLTMLSKINHLPLIFFSDVRSHANDHNNHITMVWWSIIKKDALMEHSYLMLSFCSVINPSIFGYTSSNQYFLFNEVSPKMDGLMAEQKNKIRYVNTCI